MLEATFIAHVIKPFSSHRPTEIVSAPKVYGFDTGFICYYKGREPIAIECKWSADDFDPVNLHAFRRQYGNGKNHVVANDVKRSYKRNYRDLSVEFVSLQGLVAGISG